MCGIAGYFGTIALPPARLAACMAIMGRRGPDHAASRTWRTDSGRNIYLLHSRLSIIDLDPRANQPMGSNGKWIIQNGELYNYLECRTSLQRDGVLFSTTSDTEVMLEMLARDGYQALDRCEGMWAFALFDEREGSLTLCRDRFGEKPLYLYRTQDGIYFASEIKFIVAMLGRKIPINRQQLLRYLVNGYKALYKSGETFFEGIEELAAGTLLEIAADGSGASRRYWMPQFVQLQEMSFERAVLGVRERLIRSVELRLRADVPAAFCMSGGVDSVALISIAKQVFDHDVHGFTIVNADARYEEEEMVRHAVGELGIRHTAIPVTATNFLSNLRCLVRQHDAPIYTISYYLHWLMMESIAGHGYRISVSGTAADELFSGYYDHHLAYLFEIRGNASLHGKALQSWREHVFPLIRNTHLRNADLYYSDSAFRDHIFDGADSLRGFLTEPWHEIFAEECYTNDLLRNRMANELFKEVVPVILHEDDLNAMYFSIENRSPFLDRELFEFCNTIPTRHLIRDGRAKAVLREAMRGIAPDAIIDNRRKVGFNAPIFSLLDVQDPTVRGDLLADNPVFEIVQRSHIENLLKDTSDLDNASSKFLFNFICAKYFIESFGP